MKEVLKTEYWSRAEAFLLPLTTLPKKLKYEMNAHLFWKEHTIHDYKLILSFTHNNLEEFTKFSRQFIFPILDKKGYLLENYDVGDRSIFILDLSEWAMDIQMFILGKYSKLSKEAKDLIKQFHIEKGIIEASIFGILYPNVELKVLDGKTFMEYIAFHYELDLNELKKIGETGSIYDKMSETLIVDVDELCQTGIETW